MYRLLGKQTNCYTYSKRLAEYLVYEYRDKFPVCITRPSIVLPTIKDPIPGWVDSLNGPIGILVGGGKGVIRSMMCSPDNIAEVVPVDIAVNALLIIPWKMSIEKSKEVPVYNLTAGNIAKYSYKRLLDEGKEAVYKYPFEYTVWYPDGGITTNRLVHLFYVIFFHFLPAYLIDFILLMARQKRFMVRIQNRIYVGLQVLQNFTMNDWYFHNDKFLDLANVLRGEDRNIFYLNSMTYDYNKYLIDAILGARVYCMKEPLSSLPGARRHLFM
ncbi:putative fatty acyl-CoA reductase [Blattella germanica]|nr:putative fatty acyl-CoA reductase [Blattella germanica]